MPSVEITFDPGAACCTWSVAHTIVQPVIRYGADHCLAEIDIPQLFKLSQDQDVAIQIQSPLAGLRKELRQKDPCEGHPRNARASGKSACEGQCGDRMPLNDCRICGQRFKDQSLCFFAYSLMNDMDIHGPCASVILGDRPKGGRQGNGVGRIDRKDDGPQPLFCTRRRGSCSYAMHIHVSGTTPSKEHELRLAMIDVAVHGPIDTAS